MKSLLKSKKILCFLTFFIGFLILKTLKADAPVATNAITAVPANPETTYQKNLTVHLEIPILNGDMLAARDSSQAKAFEKALDQALPTTMDSAERAKRVKTAIRYIKSFRVVDEKRVGENLSMTYEVEIQDSAFEAVQPTTAGGSPTSALPAEALSIEIVFISPMNAAETVDQIENQLKIPVQSFKLTRSAILVSLAPVKSGEEMVKEIQAFVGARAKVNLIDKNLGLPATPVTPVAPVHPMPDSLPPAPQTAPEKKTFSTPSFQWNPPTPPNSPAPIPSQP